MQFASIPLPEEISEIHRPLGLFDTFRASVYLDTSERNPRGAFAAGASRGFVSINDSSFAFTNLSTLMDLGIYGMNLVIRKLALGRDIEHAINSVVYSKGCGAFEIPHISEVKLFPFDAITKVTCHQQPISNSEMELFWKESNLVISQTYILNFKFKKKRFNIISPDSRMLSLLMALS